MFPWSHRSPSGPVGVQAGLCIHKTGDKLSNIIFSDMSLFFIMSLSVHTSYVAAEGWDLPSTVTLTFTTLCPAGLSALMMYRPLWFSLLCGMTISEVVSVEWI